MNRKLIFGLIIPAIILAACTGSSKNNEGSLNIKRLFQLGFRRTYANAQFMKDSLEIERYFEKQLDSPPVLVDIDPDTVLKARLEALGIIRGFELNLNKFKALDSVKTIDLADSLKRPIEVDYDLSRPDSAKLIFRRGSDSTSVIKNIRFPEIYFTVADIRPGGNKEILLLSKYYFMMGDNFDLDVYEVR